MKAILLTTVLLLAAAGPTAAAGGSSHLAAAGGNPAVVRCATPEPSHAEADAIQLKIDQFRIMRGGLNLRVTIPVAFHVVSCAGEGDVPQSQIDAQMRELNKAYRGTGFSFELSSVDRTENCQWFSNVTGPGVEKNMKQALAIDPAHHLNVYVVKPGHYVLGWAYFPQSLPEDSYLHGVVVHYGTLPGSYLAPYNLGGTLDHEVGHYLGLFHTFQGGCTAPGDYVDDTPFEASPAFGCPIGRNTCPQPGEDPIHNYMDYTDDLCYTEFSAGQAVRMQSIAPIYRPSLFGSALAQSALPLAGAGDPATVHERAAASGLAFRGAWPNPFADQTMLRYALPRSGHVSLRLFNVAGQQVATLVDGTMPAGEQSVTLRSATLAPGMYFAALRSDDEVVTRSIILLP